MITLALDTTTRAGSVAVLRDEDLLSVVQGDGTRTHGERLPGELDDALRAAAIGPAGLQLLVVASGPGAFTGLRIGLAAIQGLAMVLRVPCVGVSALDALALAAAESAAHDRLPVVTWMDAQRGEVFAAHYQHPLDWSGLRPVDDPVVAPPEHLLEQFRGGSGRTMFIGDGVLRYRAEIERAMGDAALILETPAALAPFVGRLGRQRAMRGEAGAPHALQPLYVRRPDAELARSRDA